MPTLGRAAQSTGSLWPGSLRRGPTALPREEPSQPLAVQPPELKHQTRKRCVPALDTLPAECSHLNEPGNTLPSTTVHWARPPTWSLEVIDCRCLKPLTYEVAAPTDNRNRVGAR